MSTLGYVPGRCSACGGRAEKSPVSARWWHLGPICPQTSMLVFQPVQRYKGRAIGPTNATARRAQFVEDAP